jgi:hypothetical protein
MTDYQCCFCSRAISPEEEETSVALTGLNFRDWLDGEAEGRTQVFWAHFACLSSGWKGSHPWEASALIDMES